MSNSDLSRKFVEVIPRSMRQIRTTIRDLANSDISTPQFRVLSFIGRHEKTSNMELAEHIGVQAPAMSRMIESLVKRGFVKREISKADRRQVTLKLSEKGKTRYEACRTATREKFALKFAELSEEKQQELAKGLEILGEIFH